MTTSAEHHVWVIGEGQMVSNYAHVLRALGFVTVEGRKGPAHAVALLLSYWDPAVHARVQLFREAQQEWDQLVVVESPLKPLEEVVRELRAGLRLSSDASALPLRSIPLARQLLSSYCHDLKYLFLPATAPSSWYFKHALDRKGASQKRFEVRQESVKSTVRQLAALCGSTIEAAAVDRLALFTDALLATASKEDSLHALLALRANASGPVAEKARDLICFGERLHHTEQLCHDLWESRFEHLPPLTHALHRRKR